MMRRASFGPQALSLTLVFQVLQQYVHEVIWLKGILNLSEAEGAQGVAFIT